MADLSDPTFWIPTIISVIAVVLFYADMRSRIKREERSSAELAKLVGVMKEELELFRKQATTGQLTSQESQKLVTLQKQNENIWKNLQEMLKTYKLLKQVFPDED